MLRDLIKSFCDEYEYGFYPDYSGRFMYGRTCVGFVCDCVNEALEELQGYLQDNNYEDADSIEDLARTDNMGLSMIIYFPLVQ